MGTDAGVADGQAPLGALYLKVGPVRGLLPVEFLPSFLIAVDLRPPVPDMARDLEHLHDAGSAHRVHAAYAAAGNIGRKLARLSRLRVRVIAIARFHIIARVAVG